MAKKKLNLQKSKFLIAVFVVLIAIVSVLFVFSHYASNTYLPVATPNLSSKFTVTKNTDGTSTLKVPYYDYMITYPSDLVVENRGGFVDESGIAVTTYQISGANNNQGISLTINVDNFCHHN